MGVTVAQLIVRLLMTSLLQFQQLSTQCLGLVFTSTVSQPAGLSTPQEKFTVRRSEGERKDPGHFFLPWSRSREFCP